MFSHRSSMDCQQHNVIVAVLPHQGQHTYLPAAVAYITHPLTLSSLGIFRLQQLQYQWMRTCHFSPAHCTHGNRCTQPQGCCWQNAYRPSAQASPFCLGRKSWKPFIHRPSITTLMAISLSSMDLERNEGLKVSKTGQSFHTLSSKSGTTSSMRVRWRRFLN